MTVLTITGNDYTLYSTTDAPGAEAASSAPAAPFVSGKYYTSSGLATTTRATASGTLYALPFYVGATTTFNRIGAEVTVAGAAASTVRLGVYAGVGVPSGEPVLDAGTIAGDATGAVELTISLTLEPGQYWLASKAESAGTFPTLRALGGTSPAVGSSTLATSLTAGTGGYAPFGVAAGAFTAYPTGVFTSIASAPAVSLKVA